MLVRIESADCRQALIAPIVIPGAQLSTGVRLNESARTVIAAPDRQAWTPIVYRNAITDPDTGELLSTAEIAELPYTV